MKAVSINDLIRKAKQKGPTDDKWKPQVYKPITPPCLPVVPTVLDTPIKTVHLVPDWIDAITSAAIERNINLDEDKFVDLRDRRVMSIGGAVGADGLSEPSHIPFYLQTLIDGLVCMGFFDSSHRPNHVLVNEYPTGGGIMPHKDGPLYTPVVAVLSLGSPVLMDFYHPARDGILQTHKYHNGDNGGDNDNDDDPDSDHRDPPPIFSVYVPDRSLLVFEHDAYTEVLHGIKARCYDKITKDVIGLPQTLQKSAPTTAYRGSRLSLTMRRVPEVTGHSPKE